LATWHNCPADPRHVWRSTVKARTGQNQGCSVCRGFQIMVGINDFQTTHPEYAAQLHPTLNDKKATELVANSGYIATWTNCVVDPRHIWRASLDSRIGKGAGCTVCLGQTIMPGINDLLSQHPEIADELHHSNPLRADEIGSGSGRVMKWECPLGHIWRCNVTGRTVNGQLCTTCVGSGSAPEFVLRQLLSSSSKWATFSGHPSKEPVAWGRRTSMLVDAVGYLNDDPGRRVVVEYDGAYFHDSQLSISRDTLKTASLLRAGYLVVRLRTWSRQHVLQSLPLSHPRLLQVLSPDSAHPEDLIPAVDEIERWLSDIVRSGAAYSEEAVLTTSGEEYEPVAPVPVRPETSRSSGVLSGRAVAFTGKMKQTTLALSRSELEAVVNSSGGSPMKAVSARTSLLVSSDLSSRKSKTALSLGVRIVSPAEFAEMVGR
jgi:hypothetical protein